MKTDTTIFFIEYSLSPENPFPVAINEVLVKERFKSPIFLYSESSKKAIEEIISFMAINEK
jgi:hypothetical protein